MKRLFGLIGFPLEHSFSPEYFKFKFQQEGITDASYNLFAIENLDDIFNLIESFHNLIGLNVTIPYKEKILAYVDEIDDVAIKVGAANTLKILNKGDKKTIKAFNTDVIGFEKSLVNFIGFEKPKALILGNGGASKAVKFVLNNLGIEFKIVSRHNTNETIVYQQLTEELLQSHELIINTTPLGMFPNDSEMPPIPYDFLNSNHYLFDLVYNPPFSVFLQLGNNRGAKVKNGLEMLELQADASWDIWTNQEGK